MIDTHAHLDMLEDADAAVERARSAGVKTILTVGIDRERWRRSLELAARHDDVRAILGIHPHNAAGDATVDELREAQQDARVVAVGETSPRGHDLPSRGSVQDSHSPARFARLLAEESDRALQALYGTHAILCEVLRLRGDLPGALAHGRRAVELAEERGSVFSRVEAAAFLGAAELALGTDSGGSIRIPAACCGVVGFKPSWGLVPLDGCFPLAPSYDHAGPMARDVATCAQMLEALAPGFSPTRVELEEVEVGVAWTELADPLVGHPGRLRPRHGHRGPRRGRHLRSRPPDGADHASLGGERRDALDRSQPRFDLVEPLDG